MSFCPAALPANKVERLQTLRSLNVLDSRPELLFDDDSAMRRAKGRNALRFYQT